MGHSPALPQTGAIPDRPASISSPWPFFPSTLCSPVSQDPQLGCAGLVVPTPRSGLRAAFTLAALGSTAGGSGCFTRAEQRCQQELRPQSDL